MVSTPAIVAREPKDIGHPNWQIEDVSVSEPGDNEILVEMIASGVCHTDLVLSSLPPGYMGIEYPKIVGHEGAGYVKQTGQSVHSVSVGDPVLLSFHSCGSCSQCDDDHPAYCDTFARENYIGRQGSVTTTNTGDKPWARFFGQSSFARCSVVDESCVVNAKGLLQSPEELKLFAPLGCGFQTGMGAVANIANAGAKDVVVVLGLGSVGMAAIMTAAIRGCKAIVGVDRLDDRLALAKELGATHTLNTAGSDMDLAEAVRALVPAGASLVVDTTGVPKLLEGGLEALRQRGKLVMIGVPPPGFELSVKATEHMNMGRSVMGCIEGDCIPKEAIPEMIRWYRDGRFPFDRLITYFEAHRFDQALKQLHDGSAVKAVLLWDSRE
ncbi:NAD/NADP dependent alcohol dehydrogenase [Aspergillus nanangensis]|uniref:NAD/NADP dependent alcohol dehydrogenase n=1 Tax=Aspergillus nanangensis TaxID=2582783 RepID=A0AAD4CWI1_ASPNN|nr:NAD/NADP dependent alcohol dehydrogenase [Aspergillus nanangensis]